jgi:hypothetical protein
MEDTGLKGKGNVELCRGATGLDDVKCFRAGLGNYRVTDGLLWAWQLNFGFSRNEHVIRGQLSACEICCCHNNYIIHVTSILK